MAGAKNGGGASNIEINEAIAKRKVADTLESTDADALGSEAGDLTIAVDPFSFEGVETVGD